MYVCSNFFGFGWQGRLPELSGHPPTSRDPTFLQMIWIAGGRIVYFVALALGYRR